MSIYWCGGGCDLSAVSVLHLNRAFFWIIGITTIYLNRLLLSDSSNSTENTQYSRNLSYNLLSVPELGIPRQAWNNRCLFFMISITIYQTYITRGLVWSGPWESDLGVHVSVCVCFSPWARQTAPYSAGWELGCSPWPGPSHRPACPPKLAKLQTEKEMDKGIQGEGGVVMRVSVWKM